MIRLQLDQVNRRKAAGPLSTQTSPLIRPPTSPESGHRQSQLDASGAPLICTLLYERGSFIGHTPAKLATHGKVPCDVSQKNGTVIGALMGRLTLHPNRDLGTSGCRNSRVIAAVPKTIVLWE